MLLGFAACNFLNNSFDKEKGQVLAQVYNRFLYEEDLQGLNLSELSDKDSLAMIRQHVDNWLRENAVLFQAQEQLSTEKLSEIDQQIEDYRNSLVLYLYERELINQKLDTTISTKECQVFYDSHPDNFKLKENILKARYFISPANNPDIDSIEVWFKELEDENIERLTEMGYRYAAKFNLSGQWFTYDDFMAQFPVETSRTAEKFLKNNTSLQFSDSTKVYMIEIEQYALLGDLSPYEYCQNDLKTIILNNRQREFLLQTKKKIYQEAVNNNKVQLYTDEN